MWTKFEKLRNVNIPGYLGDIESHLNPGHPYKDSDPITWGHEGTHGVNSLLRQNFPGNNGFYTLDDNCFIAPEPNFKLRDVAKRVPRELRHDGYQLYLVQQQRWWNDSPLYVFDELSSYFNGTMVGVEISRDGGNIDRSRLVYSFEKIIEFLGYAEAVLDLANQDEDLVDFVNYADEGLRLWLDQEFPNSRDKYNKVMEYFP
jgi:hypothetical protein